MRLKQHYFWDFRQRQLHFRWSQRTVRFRCRRIWKSWKPCGKRVQGEHRKSTNQHQSIQVRSLIWISVRKKGWRRCFRKGISWKTRIRIFFRMCWMWRLYFRRMQMMRCSLQHVTWHGVLVWRQPDIKELLRQMQLIQATGSFWKKQSRQSLYGKKKEKV